MPSDPSSPVGLHRVLAPAGRAAAGGRAAGRRARAVAGRGPGPGRAAQPRRRVLPAAARPSTAGTAPRSGPRCSTSSRPAARCRTRSPAPAACWSGSSTRSARTRRWACAVGDRVATLVSLTLTPLRITDGLRGWDGRSEQVPADGHAILFGRSIAAGCPTTCRRRWRWPCMDVCGAPALTARVRRAGTSTADAVASRSSAGPARAARWRWPPPAAPARRGPSASSRSRPRPTLLRDAGLADEVVLADARDPVALAAAVERAGRPGRRHGGLRRRPRLRARRDPRHRRRRHGDLLLDGDVVQRRRARRRGPGRRRHDARRQRLRARATPRTRSTCCAATPASARCSSAGSRPRLSGEP